MIQFFSNNATHFHHWTSHSTPCCATTQIVMQPHITVTSLHPMYGIVLYRCNVIVLVKCSEN